jgi:hypothetical protein
MTNKTKTVFAAMALIAASFASPASAEDVGVATWFPHGGCMLPQDWTVWFPTGHCITEQELRPAYGYSIRPHMLHEGRVGAPLRRYARYHHRGYRESWANWD